MRGVVGPGLTPAAACDFAAAFATLDPQGPVLVGVDPRAPRRCSAARWFPA